MGKVRDDDPDTSAEAAAKVDGNRYCALIAEHMATLKHGESRIIDELEQLLKVSRQTLSPRMTELEERGKIHRIMMSEPSASGRARYQKRKGFSGVGMTEWFYGPGQSCADHGEAPVIRESIDFRFENEEQQRRFHDTLENGDVELVNFMHSVALGLLSKEEMVARAQQIKAARDAAWVDAYGAGEKED